MRILLWVNTFHPHVGGMEAVARMLAEEFTLRGHQVTVITRTPSSERDDFIFSVIRNPSRRQLWRLVKECDVYLQNQISLKMAWPLPFLRRPWIVAHHTWIPRDGIGGWVKHSSLRFARSICCSKEIAAHIGHSSTVICSGYDERVFPGDNVRLADDAGRYQDLIFVGRLAKEKGADVLLASLSLLRSRGYLPGLTIVGDGPEKQNLMAQTREHGLTGQVAFLGAQGPRAIAEMLSRHRVMVVPSRYNEPFGIVALEGIACGCIVIGSEGGGLREAIGACGITFPNGDANALAECLSSVLDSDNAAESYQRSASSHLKKFTRKAVSESYLQVLVSAYEAARV